MIPYEDLKLVNREFEAAYRRQVEQVIASGWYILGEQVREFEKEFAGYHGLPHCVGVANGLDALVLSLRALELPPGSEVIVPSNTYIATILSILHCGLTPVLAEPDRHTYNINADAIASCITSRTSAVMVVHLYGKCCDMDAIVSLCGRRGLSLVEDCAQAHGARYKGKLAGTFGDASAFSFYPTKNLGCLGDGGAVLTASARVAERIRLLRNYGSAKKYYNEAVGYNSRLDELQAALLRVKLKALDGINGHKRRLAALYQSGLGGDFILPAVQDDVEDVYHIYAIRHQRRDELKQYLFEKGIGAEIHYPVPPHRQQALRGMFGERPFPVSEEIHRTVLSLPCSTAHTEAQVRQVIAVLNAWGQ